ncbi:MAG TPA: hypothetical protein VN363_01805, partial [Anaerolineales bacterium]|nr:hypothetical protein [Anaerolineales bacterium]
MSRIGLVAPVLAVRVGLNALLEAAGFEVSWQAASLAEIVPHLEECELVLLSTSSISRAELSQVFGEVEGRLGLLLLVDRVQEIPALTELGLRAWGVLPLEASETELAAALQALEAGLIVSTPAFSGRMASSEPGAGGNPPEMES